MVMSQSGIDGLPKPLGIGFVHQDALMRAEEREETANDQ